MRNAVILVLQLRGVATEAIKNMVLAGVGKLIIVDHENITEEDLGCCFFFRDEDVGQKVRTLQFFYPGHLMAICRDIFVRRDLMSPNRESKV